jgi:hypothetical protein
MTLFRRAIVGALVVGALIAPPLWPAGAQVPGAIFVPRDESPEEFPAGSGREETFYACTACHNFKLVAAQGMTRRQWEDSLAWMTQRHNMPPLDGKDRELVLNYLAATFPPPARAGGWQNPFAKP